MGRRNFTWHLLFSADLILGPYNASSGTLSTPGYPNVYNGEARHRMDDHYETLHNNYAVFSRPASG